SYAKMGHAPDYSWIAGRVTFTRIQGGCIFIITEAPATAAGPTEAPVGEGTVIVGTAVQHDTSPPLRDMTPEPPSAPTQQIGTSFVHGGPGLNRARFQNGVDVVLFEPIDVPG